MSSGLDRHIKIYDLGNYEVVHTLTYPAPILSFAISPDDNCLAVGMTSGLFSMQRRQAIESSEEKVFKEKYFFSAVEGLKALKTDFKIFFTWKGEKFHENKICMT